MAITHYLKRRSYAVTRLRLRTKYTFDNEFAWSNSSINAYHKERKFKVNRACVGALLSKPASESAAGARSV